VRAGRRVLRPFTVSDRVRGEPHGILLVRDEEVPKVN